MMTSKVLVLFLVCSLAVLRIHADAGDLSEGLESEDLSSLRVELEQLRSKISDLESSVVEGNRKLKSKEETIFQLEKEGKEKAEIITSLHAEIGSLQKKDAVDAAESVGRAHARAADVHEKQIENPKNGIQVQNRKKDALEAGVVEAENKVVQLNAKLENVDDNKCWSCGTLLECKEDLQNHLHRTSLRRDERFAWEDDICLKPFIHEDALLHSLPSEEDDEEDIAKVDKEPMKDLMSTNDLADIHIYDIPPGSYPCHAYSPQENGGHKTQKGNECYDNHTHFDMPAITRIAGNKDETFHSEQKLRIPSANVIPRETRRVNEDYFGSYGSFGIHRQMLSDKARTETYRAALLNNPSLMSNATVLDVGCGTGILSLFAAQAGASKVIAVDASKKMAAVASQIAKHNGLLLEERNAGYDCQCSGTISVVHGMIEELDTVIQVPPSSIDVLVSEWMGYCMLYESMLASVIYARDRWLRPGGAILPDVASIFVAGFGRGATGIPFWENVYGFDMSSIGREVLEDSAKYPIVDVVDSLDVVTKSALLKSFDLSTMKQEEMDFTSSFELEPRADLPGEATSGVTWCYGIVLWFDTEFTGRFCKEMPYTLSTSPFAPRTHWSQTIFTFSQPIAMATSRSDCGGTAPVGTEQCPASRIRSRMSIARAAVHRSIDISMEVAADGSDGRKRSWPAQNFRL